MNYKVAVASSDGKVINEHFGRATQFLIFNVEGNKTEFVELRKTVPFCNSGEHDDNKLLSSAELLTDCRAVLVAQIGNGAVQALRSKGVEAFDIKDFIDDALGSLAKYYSRIDVQVK